MNRIITKNWDGYELLDFGNEKRLERFGNVVTIRPDIQANCAPSLSEKAWKKQADLAFLASSAKKGKWQILNKKPDKWPISIQKDLLLQLKTTDFKHVGIFPEQKNNWDFIAQKLQMFKVEQPKVLNLFAYTGAASLVAKNNGADVFHVDSIRQVVSWANENMELNKLENIRWCVEDALTFLKKEVKRGRKYNGIIMDPPTFGFGKGGKRWKIDVELEALIENAVKILDNTSHFFVLNTYSPNISEAKLRQIVEKHSNTNKLECGSLNLQSSDGRLLHTGELTRFSSI